MRLLDKLFKKDKLVYTPGVFYSPVDGMYIPIKEVPDKVFADGIMGKGIGIEPSVGVLLSPAKGVATVVASTKHAIAITTEDGAELLIHIGIDTVEMKGEGFTCHIKQGEHVKFGQKLLDFDIKKIKKAGHPSVVIFVITNGDDFQKTTFDLSGLVKKLDPIGSYE